MVLYSEDTKRHRTRMLDRWMSRRTHVKSKEMMCSKSKCSRERERQSCRWCRSPQRDSAIFVQLLNETKIWVCNQPLAFDVLYRLQGSPAILCHQECSNNAHAPAHALPAVHENPCIRITQRLFNPCRRCRQMRS